MVSKKKGIPIVELKEAFRASEDFGRYTKLTKSSFCYIENGEDYPNLHSYEYNFPDDLIETTMNGLKDLLSYKLY